MAHVKQFMGFLLLATLLFLLYVIGAERGETYFRFISCSFLTGMRTKLSRTKVIGPSCVKRRR